ncbi:hypothetical protein PV797_13275 [Clostridiaceae bacterium M8S5]|nr:hypothetical protein PV797_13275 [Clostridiaceae bacterium M8S5]
MDNNFPLWIAKNKNKILVYDANEILIKKYDCNEINPHDIKNRIKYCNIKRILKI